MRRSDPVIRSKEPPYIAFTVRHVMAPTATEVSELVPSWMAHISRWSATSIFAPQSSRVGLKWALQIGAGTCPADPCRRKMFPMWWPGLPRNGHSSPANLIQLGYNQQEEFDEFTR